MKAYAYISEHISVLNLSFSPPSNEARMCGSDRETCAAATAALATGLPSAIS